MRAVGTSFLVLPLLLALSGCGEEGVQGEVTKRGSPGFKGGDPPKTEDGAAKPAGKRTTTPAAFGPSSSEPMSRPRTGRRPITSK